MHRFPASRFFLLVSVFAIGLFCGQPAHAMRCVSITLVDSTGTPVPVDKPLAAMMIGERPVLNIEVPSDVSQQIGADVSCPQELIDMVQQVFNESCPTSEQRTQTAQRQGVNIEIVNKGCSDMADALKD